MDFNLKLDFAPKMNFNRKLDFDPKMDFQLKLDFAPKIEFYRLFAPKIDFLHTVCWQNFDVFLARICVIYCGKKGKTRQKIR